MLDTCIEKESAARLNRANWSNEVSSSHQFKQARVGFPSWQQVDSHIDSIIYTLENLDKPGEIEVDNTVLINSLRLVHAIPEAYLDYLSKDDIVLTENGTITLLFEKDNQFVSIEVGRNNTNAVIKSSQGEYSSVDTIDLDSGITGNFTQLLRHLFDLNPSLRRGSVIYFM